MVLAAEPPATSCRPDRAWLIVGQRLEQFLGAELVDQGHAALGDAVGEQEAVVHRGDDVHNGIAQAGDVILLLRHENPR